MLLTVSAAYCTSFVSQFKQDQFVYENFFKNKTNGFFLDIGASDGIEYSNTYFFEKELGWKGICVEPRDQAFKDLTNNRDCICIKGCISEQEGTAQFLEVLGYAELLSGVYDKYDPRHVARINSELVSHGGSKRIIEVKCYNINKILHEHGVTHIDYLSLDTEGGELEILKSIDFETITVDVIDVENNYNDPSMRRFLEDKGYKLVKRIVCDELYVRKNFLEN